jgi:hypothetical protein
MISVERVAQLTSSKLILAFSEFVISATGPREFPSYKQINLMEVPKLVPNIFVFDYRKGIDNGILIHFSGTYLDNFFGYNFTGKYAEEIYVGGDNTELIIECYRGGHDKKRHCFARRSVAFRDHQINRHRYAESILFQCSTDGANLDYAIGFADYRVEDHAEVGIYEWL